MGEEYKNIVQVQEKTIMRLGMTLFVITNECEVISNRL